MNMVSESDLPRPVSGPMLNASAGPEWQDVPIRRKGWSGDRRSTYSRQHIHLLPRLTRQTRDLTHKVMIITSIAKKKAELECNSR